MAGVFAALGAREGGAGVLLVEPHNVLGGQGTAGGVAGFCGDTARVNGPFAELIERLETRGLIQPYNPTADRRAYDLEHMAFFLQEMVLEAGVEILFHARVYDAQAEEGNIRRVSVAQDGGSLVFAPRMVIDATGECVIPVAAGFPTMHEGPMRQLPMSLYFTLWDTGKSVGPFLPPGCPTWESDNDLPMTSVHAFPTGKLEVKMKVIGFDAADGESLSAAEGHARRQMMGLIHHLQTKGYAGTVYDRHVLASVSRQIGVREGRRIIGEHVLTEEEVRHGAIFDDAVAVGTYHLDYHWPDRVQRAGTGIYDMVEPYHIPLRALIPKGAKNLLVPGRGASGEQMAMSSFRVMAPCAQTGYAAGLAAAQCLREGTTPPTLSVPRLQEAIATGGQSLDLSDYGEYLRQHIHVHEHIFQDDRPFPACHASTLVQLPDNRFLAAWFGGTHEKHPDVGIWGAERREGRWSPPRLLAKVRQSPHWNPVLFADPAGRTHLFFKVGNEIPEWETWIMTLEDGGQSWSEPRELVPGDRGGRGPVKNKPILLSNGEWLAPASIETENGWDVFIDRSTDGGLSWEASGLLDRSAVTGLGIIQPSLWESAPGQIHMLMRSTAGAVFRSDSADYGQTWRPAYPTDLPNNNSGLDLAKLHDGTLALVFNPVAGNWAARTPLRLALSFDNGESWPRALDIETEAGEYSYPAIIPTAVGMAITYTWRRERIAFWMGSIERIPSNK
jgi:predicted neuraminidase